MRTCPPSGLILTFYARGGSLSGTKSTKFMNNDSMPWQGKIAKIKDITAAFGSNRLPIYFTEENVQTVRDNAPADPDLLSCILHPQTTRPLRIINNKIKKGYIIRLPRIVYVIVEDVFCTGHDYAGLYAQGLAFGHSFADSDITFVVSGSAPVNFLAITTDVWGIQCIPGQSADRFYGRVLYFCALSSDAYYYSSTFNGSITFACSVLGDYCTFVAFGPCVQACANSCGINDVPGRPLDEYTACFNACTVPGCVDAQAQCVATQCSCADTYSIHGIAAPACTPSSQPSDDYNNDYVFITSETDYRAYASTTQQNDDSLFSSRLVIIPVKECASGCPAFPCGADFGCTLCGSQSQPDCIFCAGGGSGVEDFFNPPCCGCGCDGTGPVAQVPLANGFGSLPLQSIDGDTFANIDLLVGEGIDAAMVEEYFGLRAGNSS